MGAEIVWRVGRYGVLRWGPRFESAETEDHYEHCGIVEPAEDDPTACIIGPVSGRMTRTDHDAILESCAAAGFRAARVRRRGRWRTYDLTVRPFRMG